MRLTDNQALVYRTIRDEELEAGADYREASRVAYVFMRDDALPDWRQFWIDWNAPPSPLAQFLSMYSMLALTSVMLRRPEFLSRFSDETAANIRKVAGLSMVDDAPSS